MDKAPSIRVAVVGLEFGAGFVPPLLAHPDVSAVGVCDIRPETLARVADEAGCVARHAGLSEVLDSGAYDAVCLFTGIGDHADQAIAVMEAGLDVASAVPMADSLEDCRKIIDVQRRTGRTYMMMETSVYTDEFFFLREMLGRGEFGRLQFFRGYWNNNLENHASYWRGLPPMHYTTHPVSQILSLAGSRAVSAVGLGSGTMRAELHEPYDNPWPIESALIRLDGCDALAEVTSITMDTALCYGESIDVYGQWVSYRASTIYGDKPALIRRHEPGSAKHCPVSVMRLDLPSYDALLPPAVRRGSRGGPRAHLVCEFVDSVRQGRTPAIDAVTAANWTAPGLCAHLSAREGGRPVDVPAFP